MPARPSSSSVRWYRSAIMSTGSTGCSNRMARSHSKQSSRAALSPSLPSPRSARRVLRSHKGPTPMERAALMNRVAVTRMVLLSIPTLSASIINIGSICASISTSMGPAMRSWKTMSSGLPGRPPMARPCQRVHTVLGSAEKAKRDMNHDTSRTWTIYNPSARNASSRPAGYTLMPMDNTATVLGRSLERGPLAFVFHHVWLTPQRDGQFYAAGASPNQAKSSYDDTLYSYADGSSVYDTDMVVSYSMGHPHLPRTEDFPLMTTRKLSVVFQPDGFFERNAVFDPPDAQIKHPGRTQQ